MNDKQLQKCLDDKMSFSQIAAMFGTTLGTVAGKVRRLKQQMAPRKPTTKQIVVFNTETRTTTAVVLRYFQRPSKPVELTKSELREMLRQALVNTSLM